MKKLLTVLAVTALIVPVFLGVSTARVSAAASIKCGTGKTYGWVTSPVNALKVGAKYCRTITPLENKEGAFSYWFQATNGKWIPTTNNQPNSGGTSAASKAHAKAAKDLGKKYGVYISFAKYTGFRDSTGYVNKSGVRLPGTYYQSPAYPGKGMVEISNGANSLGAADATVGKTKVRNHLLDTVRHEISHARIELKCGTTKPAIAGDRVENVTDAYAVTHFGKKRIDYPFTAAEVTKAKKIAQGICK
jgi:hypothetical protein